MNTPGIAPYARRVIDDVLDELMPSLAAISLQGPKGVGKTSTAVQRANTVRRLDDPATLEIGAADPARLLAGPAPVLLDEWQRMPAVWDLVRRAVDENQSPGRFILTGSATPRATTHSGAGRIVPLRMRPLAFSERGLGDATVSVRDLLDGTRPDLGGRTQLGLADYTHEILCGGFPGIRLNSGRAQRAALDGYLESIITIDLPELGIEVRRPEVLRRWLRAYAAATATHATYETIRDAASSGEGDKPAKTTTGPYRDALERIWILDPVSAWAPTPNRLSRLVGTPKHHLADPALAARLCGVAEGALLDGRGPAAIPRDGTFLGALFDSLTTLSIRTYAEAAEARTLHLRTAKGEREVDLVLSRSDDRVVAIEIKLARTVDDHDVRHLNWLQARLGEQLLDSIIITTGEQAFRRRDGVGVVPLALLGP